MQIYKKIGLPGEETTVELLFPRIVLNGDEFNDFGEHYKLTDISFDTGFSRFVEKGVYWAYCLTFLGFGIRISVQKGY